MTPTGELDGGALVLRRTFPTGIDHVWASITESERLACWFGTWTGDPTSGSVMVTMNAEAEPGPAVPYAIEACDPPHLLSVSADGPGGRWHLTAHLSEVDGATTLVLTQRDVDLDALRFIGPGWEWYLDRLVGAVTDREPPSMEAFETDYLSMSPAYKTLIDGVRPESDRPTDS